MGQSVMEHAVIFVCMFINAGAGSVMIHLHLRPDFHNIIFKLKHK